MTDHPITPTPELVQQWIEEDEGGPGAISRIATRAAQWGYLQHEKALLDAMHATELPPS